MTKEQALQNELTGTTAEVDTYPNILRAMDAYARQEAIAFNWWLTLGDWKPRITNEWCRYECGDIKIYSTEELYNEYEDWKLEVTHKNKRDVKS